ncbi:hypothetical protein BDN67DRAFT_969048 [Paxillus ammoniavirescens]|nr:hypothetical protein BDN67DRAFT_969048 [Paxillus ammoniavirescens]
MGTKNVYAAPVQESEQDDVCGVASTPAPRPYLHHPSNSLETLKKRYRAAKARVMDFVEANSGILLVMLAQTFSCLMYLAVKVLDQLDTPVPPLEVIIIRMVITFICCVVYMVIMKIPDPFLGPEGVRLLLVCRGVLGFFGLFGIYYALQYMSLADTVVVTFLGPLFTGVAGHFILKESYSKREALAGLCSLAGVVLIARPPFLFGNSSIDENSDDSAIKATPTQRFTAVTVVFLGVFLATGAMISIRAIGKRAHAMHCMTFFSLWCVIVASSAMIFFKVPVVYPTQWRWAALLLLIGVCGFAGQTFLTMGLQQRDTAARGSMGIYIQAVIAGVLDRIVFKTAPSFLSMIGSAIIIGSTIYVIFTKEAQPKTTSDVSLDSEDAALEEGLLNEDLDSQEEFVKLEDMGGARSPLALSARMFDQGGSALVTTQM